VVKHVDDFYESPTGLLSRHSRCKNCYYAHHKPLKKKYRESYKITGKCARCQKPAMPNNRNCEPCWWKETARQATRRSSDGAEIRALFDRQGGCCVYTGEVLVPGNNASLDHRTPRVRGGADTLSNLQWVTKAVNTAKGTFTHEEFVLFCRKVVERCPLGDVSFEDGEHKGHHGGSPAPNRR
jgi:hypothetical protein